MKQTRTLLLSLMIFIYGFSTCAFAKIEFHESAQGPFTPGKSFIYTDNDYHSNPPENYHVKWPEKRIGIRLLTPEENIGFMYGTLFEYEGLGLNYKGTPLDLANHPLKKKIKPLYDKRQFKEILPLLEGYINKEWVLTDNDLHHQWAQRQYPWHKKLANRSESITSKRSVQVFRA